MRDPDDRADGFYWIKIGDQEAEVAQWQAEWVRWLVAGENQPLSDMQALRLVVLSDRLVPPEPSTTWAVFDLVTDGICVGSADSRSVGQAQRRAAP